MLNVHSVNKGFTPFASDPKLGTEGFDFFSALLGLQAEMSPTGLGSESLFEKLLPDATAFGQDAAMPMPAESGWGGITQSAFNLPEFKSDSGARNLVSTEVPARFGSAEVNGKLEASALELLRTPIENLTPSDVQKVIETFWNFDTTSESLSNAAEVAAASGVWKDIKSAVVEELPSGNSGESLQHALLQKFAPKAEPKLPSPKAFEQSVSVDNVSQKPELSVATSHVERVSAEKDDKRVPPSKEGSADLVGDLVASSRQSTSSDRAESAEALSREIHASASSRSQLTTPVFTHVEDLAQKGGGKMTLQLDPPEMGRLTIEVTTKGKQVEVAIRADNESTRSLLENGMGDLRLSLQSQDLQLTHTEVSRTFESSFADHSFSGGHSGSDSSFSREGGSAFSGREEKAWARTLLTESPVARYRNSSRLDVRV
jgi:hypothetical protein